MVPAILILTFAWTLSGVTNLLGAREYVSGVFAGSAAGLKILLPAIVFAVAVGMSFSTGTSWGTFGILLPIVVAIGLEPELLIISISACLAGAVCGDHCSPISDTTIMSSTGAMSNHINHVTTQLPYALTVAAVSFVGYIFAGLVQSAWVVLPVSMVVLFVVLYLIKMATGSIDETKAQAM
jgi:Na+/H+ antiporter NhaC